MSAGVSHPFWSSSGHLKTCMSVCAPFRCRNLQRSEDSQELKLQMVVSWQCTCRSFFKNLNWYSFNHHADSPRHRIFSKSDCTLESSFLFLLRQGLTRLALNSLSPCFQLLSAAIAGIHSHTCLCFYFWLVLSLAFVLLSGFLHFKLAFPPFRTVIGT